MSEQLRDYVNLQGNDDIHIFLRSTKKKTAKMKYDQFLEVFLPISNQTVKKYIDGTIQPAMQGCKNVDEISKLQLPVLTDEMRQAILEFVDMQKSFNIVEKGFIFADCIRAVSMNIGDMTAKMALHFANTLQNAKVPILGLNGKRMN